MKKSGLLLAAAALVLMGTDLTGCQTQTYEYALVTDVGDIDDQSFNQTSWEATRDFAKANGKTVNYYRPTEDSTKARLAAMEQAVNKGAKVIVCPGFLFEDAVYEAQVTYPDVKFVLIDGQPHTADYQTYETKNNTVSIIFKEEIAGFLAGYAAVKDGNTKLGFCGGMAVPAVQRYGSGFVQGADAASKEMGINTTLKYYYAGAFAATDGATATMKSWYTEGTETVFACGGKVFQSVVAGCEQGSTKATWIGVDTDQAYVSEKVLTSAMKGLSAAVTSALEVYSQDKWTEIGGHDYNLGLDSVLGTVTKKDYVGIPTADASWRFKTFTKAEYEAVLTKVKSGEITISGDVKAAPVTEKVTVTWVSPFAQ